MIHQYKSNGYNIVLDVYSGAVHVVDDIVYDLIEEINKNQKIVADIDKYHKSDNKDIHAINFDDCIIALGVKYSEYEKKEAASNCFPY